MIRHWPLIRDAAVNRLTAPAEIVYISDRSNWAINSVAQDVVTALHANNIANARVSSTHYGTRNTTLHFGSPYTYLLGESVHATHRTNKLVVSIFHIPPGDDRTKRLVDVQERISVFHVPTSITKSKLIEYGIAPEKIAVIPFGVDLTAYAPVHEEQKRAVQKKLGIPPGHVVVGSFQKDGHGWQEGLEPKMVKGPDLFVNAAAKVSNNLPLFVLLAGPARGYVRAQLTKHAIPYRDIGYQSSRGSIATAYHALDAYIISSRVEGGPLQLLEAWASKIPVVSTKVGMVADLGRDKENIFITDTTADDLAAALIRLWHNKVQAAQIREHAYASAQAHAWPIIARHYYERLYRR